jgi:hypothetical protein
MSRRGLQAVEQVTGAKIQVSCLLSWSCERNSGSQASLERHTCGLGAAAWGELKVLPKS